nr:E140 [uncultured bacterium]
MPATKKDGHSTDKIFCIASPLFEIKHCFDNYRVTGLEWFLLISEFF